MSKSKVFSSFKSFILVGIMATLGVTSQGFSKDWKSSQSSSKRALASTKKKIQCYSGNKLIFKGLVEVSRVRKDDDGQGFGIEGVSQKTKKKIYLSCSSGIIMDQ